MRKFISFILLSLLIFTLFTSIFISVSTSLEIIDDSWYVKQSMNQARYGLGVIAVEDKIYAIGGYSGGYVGTNECYNPMSNTWIVLKAMPTPRMNFGIAAYDGKIYCIGGSTFGSSTLGLIDRLSVNEVYDIATDSWSAKASLPFNERYLHAHAVDGKIFVTGPKDTFKYEHEFILYMYDPVEDSWTQKTGMPQTPIGTTYITSAVVDNNIIFVGTFGVDPSTCQQKVLIYDTKSDKWSEGATSSTQQWRQLWCGYAGATTGVYAPKHVYALGITSNDVYDPVNNVWSFAKAMSTERASFGVAVVNDVLYVIGGYTSTDFHSIGSTMIPSALNEQYVPIGYNGTLPPVTSPPAVTSTPSTLPTSPEQYISPKPTDSSTSFLTGPVLITIALTVCISITAPLFFYLYRKKVNTRIKYE